MPATSQKHQNLHKRRDGDSKPGWDVALNNETVGGILLKNGFGADLENEVLVHVKKQLMVERVSIWGF